MKINPVCNAYMFDPVAHAERAIRVGQVKQGWCISVSFGGADKASCRASFLNGCHASERSVDAHDTRGQAHTSLFSLYFLFPLYDYVEVENKIILFRQYFILQNLNPIL